MAHYKLISFELCPYVQRSIITLRHKGLPYDLENIDLKYKPDWFLKISPLGKVPVLVMDEKEILFESSVINEYLDETTEPRLLPKEPLVKAKQRAWIEISSFLLGLLYQVQTTKSAEILDTTLSTLNDRLKIIEAEAKLKYFCGDEFGLVDSAFAPFVARLFLIKKNFEMKSLGETPRLEKYYENLIATPAVRESFPENFEKKMLGYLSNAEGALAQRAK